MSTTGFKKLVGKIALLALIVSVPLSFLESAVRKFNFNEGRKYQELRYGKSEILIMGSSHALNGILPSSLRVGDLTAYNIAFGGASVRFNLALYRDLLSKRPVRPKLIIYNTDWFMFDQDWLPRKRTHDAKFDTISLPGHSFSKLYVLAESNVLLTTWRTRKNTVLKQYNDKGCAALKDNIYVADEHTQARVYNEQVASLQELVAALKRDGIPVVFVQSPELVSERHFPEIESGDGIIARVAAENGIPFLNYNEGKRLSAINYDRRYFYNWGHLNHLGAERFSRTLGEDLNNLLHCPPESPISR